MECVTRPIIRDFMMSVLLTRAVRFKGKSASAVSLQVSWITLEVVLKKVVDKVNLLLVDDLPNNLMALSAILDDPEYNVMTASSGREALEHLTREEFACVLLDVMMPEMDGYVLAAAMKQIESLRYIPILFVTAIARDVKQIYKGYSVGAVDYLLKPLDPDVVRAKVAVFAELFRQKKEIQRQAEVIRTSERFRDLVNALDHAVIWEGNTDLSEITFVSERVENILGYPRERWLHEPGFFMDHVFHEDRAKLQKTIHSCLNRHQTGLGERCEHRMVGADGTLRWFHTGLQGDRSGDKPISKLRGLCVEISPLKKVEEQLRNTIQAKDEIVSVVAHDLKTPLSAADLGSSLLKMAADRGDLSEARKQVSQVKHAIKHTIRLANNILDAEKIKSGHLALETKLETASELIEETVEMLRPLAEEKSICIHIDVDRGAEVDCDRQRILQVLSNLFGNAIKFSFHNSNVWVKGEKVGADFCFSIKDEGPGISEGHLEHVFKRFWRDSNNRSSGLGLGLTISKGIVEAHGGKIWVESEKGGGTIFYFSLPAEANVHML